MVSYGDKKTTERRLLNDIEYHTSDFYAPGTG
jgi:hypothetical protein